MSLKDGDPGGLSPQDLARILSGEIADEISAGIDGPEPNYTDRLAYGEKILDLHDRAVELLRANGHEALLSEMVSANWNYFSRLLMHTATARFLDTTQEGDEKDSLVRPVMEMVGRRSHSEPLTQPSIDDYADRLPAGFEDLFRAVFVVDITFNQARYEQMRDTTNSLLNLIRGKNPESQ